MYYKGCEGITEHERSLVKTEYERIKMIVEEQKMSKKLELKDFCNRMAFKGIATSLAMAWFIQTTGSFLITNYASLIFGKTGTMLDPHISSIILAVVQIVAGLLSTQLGDTFGRKTTLFISLSGSAAGLFILTFYSYLRHTGYDLSNYMWLPVTCLSLIIFISNAGIIALANICAIENYPSKVSSAKPISTKSINFMASELILQILFLLQIRTAGVVIYSLFVSVVAFFADKYFPILLEAIHLHGCLLFFGISCSCGLIFVAFMKETKGKSLDTIEVDEKPSQKDSTENKV